MWIWVLYEVLNMDFALEFNNMCCLLASESSQNTFYFFYKSSVHIVRHFEVKLKCVL